jgi:hypothetical protein
MERVIATLRESGVSEDALWVFEVGVRGLGPDVEFKRNVMRLAWIVFRGNDVKRVRRAVKLAKKNHVHATSSDAVNALMGLSRGD